MHEDSLKSRWFQILEREKIGMDMECLFVATNSIDEEIKLQRVLLDTSMLSKMSAKVLK